MWEQTQQFFLHLHPVAWNLFLVAIAVLAALIFHWISLSLFRRFNRQATDFSLVRSIVTRLEPPLRFFLPLFVLDLLLPLMKMTTAVYAVVDKLVGILLIISFSALLIAMVKVAQDYVVNTYALNKENNLKERKIRTELQFIRKLVIGLIITLTIATILLSFESMRRLGAGLLTGVGIGGIIVGFAAQRSLSNLLAGLQIAFTQPMRIDDIVVMEGEWGRVEEITLTYVVLNAWDERRLIVPINYFIEKSFQNWTRNSSQLLGTVFLYLDYTAPIEAIRNEFTRLVQASPLWDKRAQALQVTETSEQTIQVRALVSASNSSNMFDLRCYVREQLVIFIQKNYPEALPKTRAVWPEAPEKSGDRTGEKSESTGSLPR